LAASPGCVWIFPQPGQLGTLTRNALVQPAFTRIDMAVARIFPMNKWRQGMRFTFRADAFNIFNTPNLGPPNAVVYPAGIANGAYVNNLNTGEVTGTTGSNTVAGPVGRRLQLSGTLYF